MENFEKHESFIRVHGRDGGAGRRQDGQWNGLKAEPIGRRGKGVDSVLPRSIIRDR